MFGPTLAGLVTDALSMAFLYRKQPAELLHHSDRGSQYACNDCQKLLFSRHMVPEHEPRRGYFRDNASTESFSAASRILRAGLLQERLPDRVLGLFSDYRVQYYKALKGLPV